MTSLKSTKLGGFRNALRRLLHKTPPPAGDGSGRSSPAGGSQQQPPPQQYLDRGSFLEGGANGDALPSSPSKTGDGHFSSSEHTHPPGTTATAIDDHDDWSQALNGDFSQIVQSHAHDDEATILRNTAAAARESRRQHDTGSKPGTAHSVARSTVSSLATDSSVTKRTVGDTNATHPALRTTAGDTTTSGSSATAPSKEKSAPRETSDFASSAADKRTPNSTAAKYDAVASSTGRSTDRITTPDTSAFDPSTHPALTITANQPAAPASITAINTATDATFTPTNPTSDTAASASSAAHPNSTPLAAATTNTSPAAPTPAPALDTPGTFSGYDMAPARPLAEQTRSTQKAPLSAQLPPKPENKENVPPEKLTSSLAGLKIGDSPQKGDVKAATAKIAETPAAEVDDQPEIDYAYLNDPVVAAERAQHLRFIGEALDMARLALKINETPVGCVLVHDGKVIAKGMNATNVTRNGTRHAEYMALAALFSYASKEGPRSFRLKPKQLTDREEEEKAARLAASDEDAPEAEMPDAVSETLSTDVSPHDGNEDGKKGHLYPYGQKMLDIERVDRSIVAESVLYVTVEPCIMCASLLRQLNIKKVYFGAVNDKFGGTGGVFSLHANSLPVREDGQTAAAHPIAKPIQLPDGTGGSLGVSFPPGGGDGGNVEPGYEIEGGWGRDDAVALLRRFYVQENGRAPVPRKKEGRAARLAAIMGQDGVEGDADGETVTPSEDTNGANTDDVRRQSSESSYEDAPTELNGADAY